MKYIHFRDKVHLYQPFESEKCHYLWDGEAISELPSLVTTSLDFESETFWRNTSHYYVRPIMASDFGKVEYTLSRHLLLAPAASNEGVGYPELTSEAIEMADLYVRSYDLFPRFRQTIMVELGVVLVNRHNYYAVTFRHTLEDGMYE